MIIPISDDYRIEGTRYAWEVQRAFVRKSRRSGKRETHWNAIKWYSSLPAALEGLADLRLRTAKADNLLDAAREAKSIAAELGKALASVCKELCNVKAGGVQA